MKIFVGRPDLGMRSWRRSAHAVLILVMFMTCLLLAEGASARAPRYQPDGMIKRASDQHYVGRHIWNTTAAGQTRAVSALAGQMLTFELQFQNDGRAQDKFGIKGCASGDGLSVHYLQGGGNVTSRVVDGRYTTRMLAPGAIARLTMKITVGSNFASTVTCQVASTSKGSPGREDVVAAQVYTQA